MNSILIHARADNNARVRLLLDHPSLTWEDLKKAGIHHSRLSDFDLLTLLLNVARTEYKRTGSIFFWIVTKQKRIALQVLKGNKRMSFVRAFLDHDFTDPKWQKAAKKTGFLALSTGKWDSAVMMFLLKGDVNAALFICLKKMNDLPLAIVLCRLGFSSIDDERQALKEMSMLSPSGTTEIDSLLEMLACK